jgi:hypothetical protein
MYKTIVPMKTELRKSIESQYRKGNFRLGFFMKEHKQIVFKGMESLGIMHINHPDDDVYEVCWEDVTVIELAVI